MIAAAIIGADLVPETLIGSPMDGAGEGAYLGLVCDWCEEPHPDMRSNGCCIACYPNDCERCGAPVRDSPFCDKHDPEAAYERSRDLWHHMVEGGDR